MNFLLSADERRRLSAWLESEASSDECLAQQCRKINSAVMAEKLESDAKAERLVAAKLAATESKTR